MSQTLQTIEKLPPLPPKVTKRQMRLAALLPRCETAAEAMRLAGYSTQTIDKRSRSTTGSIGVRRAEEAIAAEQADKARGLVAFGIKGLANSEADLAALEPRDRFAVSFKAIELGHAVGENVTASGNGTDWKIRLRRAMRLAYRFGYNKGRIPPPTTTLD